MPKPLPQPKPIPELDSIMYYQNAILDSFLKRDTIQKIKNSRVRYNLHISNMYFKSNDSTDQ